VQVSPAKNELVLPSIAFCGSPPAAVDICMGALPAATFNTATMKKVRLENGRSCL